MSLLSKLVLNPRLESEAKNGRAVRDALHKAATDTVQEAEQLGGEVAQSYAATVVEDSDGVHVVADTDEIGAAGWIEFGTPDMAPHAPLRRGSEAAGLKWAPGS